MEHLNRWCSGSGKMLLKEFKDSIRKCYVIDFSVIVTGFYRLALKMHFHSIAGVLVRIIFMQS